jgi:transcriptional regulator with XRE-family HTH domain
MKTKINKKMKLKFKNKIKEYRENRGISIKVLSEAIGKSVSAVYQIEIKKCFPRGETREKLLKFFNCNFNKLFYEDWE